jgi:hypothetical protein
MNAYYGQWIIICHFIDLLWLLCGLVRWNAWFLSDNCLLCPVIAWGYKYKLHDTTFHLQQDAWNAATIPLINTVMICIARWAQWGGLVSDTAVNQDSFPSQYAFQARMMKRSAFWDIMLCDLLKVNQHSRGKCHFHLQCWRVRQARNQYEAGSRLLLLCLAYSSTMNMESMYSSEHWLTLNGILGVISQKIEILVTATVRISYPTHKQLISFLIFFNLIVISNLNAELYALVHEQVIHLIVLCNTLFRSYSSHLCLFLFLCIYS